MRTTRIYTDSELVAGTSVCLDERASHHLSRVLRCKSGDPLIVFNGRGSQCDALVENIGKKQVTVTLREQTQPPTESPLQTHLGIGISKGDRFDWVLQKSTELGVTSITPLLTERTEFRLKAERLEKKLYHWQQILISACEQCGRNVIPRLNPPLSLSEWVTASQASLKLVLHHRSSCGLDTGESPGSVALLIGPEGGLSDSEIGVAEQAGFKALTLGPRVLRTETAPLAALAVIQSLWGDV